MEDIAKIQDLIEALTDLIDERDEKQGYFDEANDLGEAEEADSIHEAIEDVNSMIQDVKIKLARLLDGI